MSDRPRYDLDTRHDFLTKFRVAGVDAISVRAYGSNRDGLCAAVVRQAGKVVLCVLAPTDWAIFSLEEEDRFESVVAQVVQRHAAVRGKSELRLQLWPTEEEMTRIDPQAGKPLDQI